MIDWLYSKVKRVPGISDAKIAEMRHIEPVLRDGDSCWYRRVNGIAAIHPRDQSFLWDAQPIGDKFTFQSLNQTTIITQHHSSVFFKPSLAEVYAWIRFYLRDDWQAVRFFCMGDVERIGGSSDFSCKCMILGGEQLIPGPPSSMCPGARELVPLVEAR